MKIKYNKVTSGEVEMPSENYWKIVDIDKFIPCCKWFSKCFYSKYIGFSCRIGGGFIWYPTITFHDADCCNCYPFECCPFCGEKIEFYCEEEKNHG